MGTKIVKLEAENVKRLVAVNIEPSGAMVVIGGQNGAGKSSVLDAIEYALAGGRSLPDVPVRQGEDAARVLVELDDLVVTKTIGSAGRTSLVVANKEGAAFPSPQAMLDKLVGPLSFDPLSFLRMPPANQRATLQELIGLNFDEQNGKRATLYQKRTAVGRGVRDLKGQVKAMPFHADAPAEEVSVADLSRDLREAQGINKAAFEAQGAATRAEQDVAASSRAVATAQQAVVDAQTRLESAIAARDEIDAEAKRLREAADKAPTVECDPLHERITAAEGINQKVRENAAVANTKKRLVEAEKEQAELSNAIAKIDGGKAKALAKAEFPVEGLEFDDEGVTFGGLPLGQASQAEQLRVSVAMGLALNPDLKVLLIRDGSLLDEANLALLRDMATEAGAQVWIERVGEDKDCTVIIEDGQVKGHEADATE